MITCIKMECYVLICINNHIFFMLRLHVIIPSREREMKSQKNLEMGGEERREGENEKDSG